jgi:hypothetical protein
LARNPDTWQVPRRVTRGIFAQVSVSTGFLDLARHLQWFQYPAIAADHHIPKEASMFKSDLIRTVAAVACTIVFSATTVIAAVGPAQPEAGRSAVAMAARLTA